MAKKYIVAFSAVTDKVGDVRLKGETVSLDELPDPDFQISIGAVVETGAEAKIEAPQPSKPAKK